MVGAGILAGGISVASSIHKYATWDRYNLDKKIEILSDELGMDNLYLDAFSKEFGYTKNKDVYLTPLGLENKSISKLTVFHENIHISDINPTYPYYIPEDKEFVIKVLETRAHLGTLNAAPNYNISSRYWWNSRVILRKTFGYRGSIPNTLDLKHVWYNLF